MTLALNPVNQGPFKVSSVYFRLGFVFRTSFFKAFVNPAIEGFDIFGIKGFLASGYRVIALHDCFADKLLEFQRPDMAGIVRILLAVPLEMLVALDILEAELLVVVVSVVVAEVSVVSLIFLSSLRQVSIRSALFLGST